MASLAVVQPQTSWDRPPVTGLAREVQRARARRDVVARRVRHLLAKRPYAGLAGAMKRGDEIAVLVAEYRALSVRILDHESL